jgi:ABC-type Zn uptake system ZnuABC Zn-binding protein ZnuA
VRPSHILKLKRADLFLHAGLDLEMWRGPMTDAAARPEVRAGGARELDLSRTVSLAELPTGSLTRAQGDIHLFGNPHYWLDPHNGIKLGAEIAKKLTEVDPAGEKLYQLNYQKFATDVENHILVWQTRAKSAAIRNFIGYHNEWVYLIDFLGGKNGVLHGTEAGHSSERETYRRVAAHYARREICGDSASKLFAGALIARAFRCDQSAALDSLPKRRRASGL